MHSNTFAARAGRWSAQHRKKAIWGWIAFVVIAFASAAPPASRAGQPGRLRRAVRPGGEAVDDHFAKQDDERSSSRRPRAARRPTPPSARRSTTPSPPSRGKPGVANVQSPYEKGNEGQVSKDGRSVLVQFDLKGDTTRPTSAIDPTSPRSTRSRPPTPRSSSAQFGGASVNKALVEGRQGLLQKALSLSLPTTLIILLITFGALVAAGIPLLLGLTAVIGTLGLVAGVSHIVPMDNTVTEVVLLVGLAVGVDYSLFYLRREREERARAPARSRPSRSRPPAPVVRSSSPGPPSWWRWPACSSPAGTSPRWASARSWSSPSR